MPAFQFTVIVRGERKKTVTTRKAYLVFSMGQAGQYPIGLWSTAYIISGIRWTRLDPSYPHFNSLSVKHQKFGISPKSTKVLRNLSINFIWIGLWGPNVFTLRVGRKNWLLFLCFAFSEGMFSLCMLSFHMKTPFPLLHCYSALKTPFLAVIEGSLTLESISIGSISYWDYLTRPCEMLLSDYLRGLKMEVTFFAFQEWLAKDFLSELRSNVRGNALFCLVLGQTTLWWHKHMLVSDSKSVVKWRHLSFLVGVWGFYFVLLVWHESTSQ